MNVGRRLQRRRRIRVRLSRLCHGPRRKCRSRVTGGLGETGSRRYRRSTIIPKTGGNAFGGQGISSARPATGRRAATSTTLLAGAFGITDVPKFDQQLGRPASAFGGPIVQRPAVVLRLAGARSASVSGHPRLLRQQERRQSHALELRRSILNLQERDASSK